MATKKEPLRIDQSKALAGMLALLAADREERIDAGEKSLRKTELVLSEIGLTAPEIAQLIDKPQTGVAKAITRGRAGKQGAKSRGK